MRAHHTRTTEMLMSSTDALKTVAAFVHVAKLASEGHPCLSSRGRLSFHVKWR
jgi:hypothetical protein